MSLLSSEQLKRALFLLISFHIFIIALSNYLVQLPLQVFGFFTTWGTFSFPFIYLATDLTVRIFGSSKARKIIFGAMLPALLASYLVSVIFFEGKFQGVGSLENFNSFVFRIALASFVAYVIGQLADIKIFAKLRQHRQWWVAPSASTLIGNLIDTVIFYSIAFANCSDQFMSENWPEIATLDYCFKIIVSLLLFLPLYGVLLKKLSGLVVGGKQE